LVGKLTAVYQAEPATAAILQALQSDPDLRRFNQKMNEQFARMIAKFLRAGGAQSDSRSLMRSARLVVLIVTLSFLTSSRLVAPMLRTCRTKYQGFWSLILENT
jgi:hypothetical protein